MYQLWTRHNVWPGEYWNASRGEQLMLAAFMDKEIEDENKQLRARGVSKRGGQ